MKTIATTRPAPRGNALCFSALRSVLLPGMICPLRTENIQVQRQLALAMKQGTLLLVRPTDHLQSGVPISVGCLTTVVAHCVKDDGSSISTLRGIARAETNYQPQPIDSGFDALTNIPYHIQPDFYPCRTKIDRKQRRSELLNLFRQHIPPLALHDSSITLFFDELPLGSLCDLIASSLPLSRLDARQLLSEQNVDRRSDFILEQLKSALTKHSNRSGAVLPLFSRN